MSNDNINNSKNDNSNITLADNNHINQVKENSSSNMPSGLPDKTDNSLTSHSILIHKLQSDVKELQEQMQQFKEIMKQQSLKQNMMASLSLF